MNWAIVDIALGSASLALIPGFLALESYGWALTQFVVGVAALTWGLATL